MGCMSYSQCEAVNPQLQPRQSVRPATAETDHGAHGWFDAGWLEYSSHYHVTSPIVRDAGDNATRSYSYLTITDKTAKVKQQWNYPAAR